MAYDAIKEGISGAIAETEAYIIYLLKHRQGDKSALSYYRGVVRGLEAVNAALEGSEGILKDMSITTFRKTA